MHALRTKVVLGCLLALAVSALAYQASLIPSSSLIQPEELAKIVEAPRGGKPLILQTGSHVLFQQAHISGSEYVGAASTEAGQQSLKKRVEGLPKNTFIVLYCGCCPWGHCPNVEPADRTLRSLGFIKVKTLYIANNFGTDWVQKGYPTAKGD